MIARPSRPPLAVPSPATGSRASLRLRSLSWALLAAITAGSIGLLLGVALAGGIPEAAAAGLLRGLDPALRAAGCGFFYGLLAFHLQRVDPDDGHLQAGLVGAVCGIRSLGSAPPLALSYPVTAPLHTALALLQGWWPLWLPLVGSALLLQLLPKLLPGLRPAAA